MVHREQKIRLHELRLDRGGAHRDERLAREHRRTLRHGPDVAGEPEIAEVLQKFLAEDIPRAEILDILVGEVEIGDVFHDLLQPRGNGKAAAVRHLPEEKVEVGNAVFVPVAEVAVAHRKLIKIAEHRKVLVAANVHGKISSCRQCCFNYTRLPRFCKAIDTGAERYYSNINNDRHIGEDVWKKRPIMTAM